jgi:hypothetical protein
VWGSGICHFIALHVQGNAQPLGRLALAVHLLLHSLQFLVVNCSHIPRLLHQQSLLVHLGRVGERQGMEAEEASLLARQFHAQIQALGWADVQIGIQRRIHLQRVNGLDPGGQEGEAASLKNNESFLENSL